MISRRIVAPSLALGLAAVLSLGVVGTSASAEELLPDPSGAPVVPSEEPTALMAEETHTLVLSPSSAVVGSGVPVTFEVTVLAEEGGAPLDPQPELEYVLGTDASGDVVDGMTVTASTDGPRTVFVRSGSQYGMTSLTVIGDPAVLQITPSAPSVAKGGALSFAVTGTDRWGTPIDGSAAVLTSSVGTDVVDGQTVTFPTASPHTITATLGGARASVTVEVIGASDESPAAPTAPTTPTGLAETGATPLGAGTTAAMLMLAGAAISALTVARRRARRQ